MNTLLPIFEFDATTPEERISKLKTVLNIALESLESGDINCCSDSIQCASKCVQFVFGDMEDTELDMSSPVNAETTVLWLYSKLLSAGVAFEPIELECINDYFKSVEPCGDFDE